MCMSCNIPDTSSTNRLGLRSHFRVLAVVLWSAWALVLWPLAFPGSSPSVVVSSASALLEAGVWARSLPAEVATYS